MLVCSVACILERGLRRVVSDRVCFRPTAEAALNIATDSEAEEEAAAAVVVEEGEEGEDPRRAAAAFAPNHRTVLWIVGWCTGDRGPNGGSGVRNCAALGSILNVLVLEMFVPVLN